MESLVPKTSIDSKREFYEYYNRGLLGNKLGTWTDWKDVPNNVTNFGLRTAGGINGLFIPDLLFLDAIDQYAKLREEGNQTIICEMAKKDQYVLHGEIYRSPYGLHLEYSTVKEHFRDAFKEERKKEFRLQAKLFLQYHLEPNSYDDLMELLDMFPSDDTIVEFTVFDRSVGIYNRNIVIWEVRTKY